VFSTRSPSAQIPSGIGKGRSKGLSRRRGATCSSPRGCAKAASRSGPFSQSKARSRNGRHLDRRQDVVVERWVALAQVKKQSLQRFAADGGLRFFCASRELRIDLAPHRKLAPFHWHILLDVLWCRLFFLCLRGSFRSPGILKHAQPLRGATAEGFRCLVAWAPSHFISLSEVWNLIDTKFYNRVPVKKSHR
jgi:hypothetical protein